jgi:predicted RNA-binding protein YlqC (UPF0109 family)
MIRSQATEGRSSFMNQPVDDLCEMLLAVTRSLVDHPDEIRINPVSDAETVTLRVYVHPQDAGKLIGVNGRMARALRVILQANAVKLRLRLLLNICSTEANQLDSTAAD